MARGNQRDKAREAAQKKAASVVRIARKSNHSSCSLLTPWTEKQEHHDRLPAGCRPRERCCHHAEEAGRRLASPYEHPGNVPLTSFQLRRRRLPLLLKPHRRSSRAFIRIAQSSRSCDAGRGVVFSGAHGQEFWQAL